MNPSITAIRRRPSKQSRGGAVLLWTIGLFVLGHGVGGLLLDRYGLGIRFPNAIRVWKDVANGPRPNIIWMGSSRSEGGIRHDVIDAGLRQHFGERRFHLFNGSVLGGDPYAMELLLDGFFTRGQKPEILILEVTHDELARESEYVATHLNRQTTWADLADLLPQAYEAGKIGNVIQSRAMPLHLHRQQLRLQLVDRVRPLWCRGSKPFEHDRQRLADRSPTRRIVDHDRDFRPRSHLFLNPRRAERGVERLIKRCGVVVQDPREIGPNDVGNRSIAGPFDGQDLAGTSPRESIRRGPLGVLVLGKGGHACDAPGPSRTMRGDSMRRTASPQARPTSTRPEATIAWASRRIRSGLRATRGGNRTDDEGWTNRTDRSDPFTPGGERTVMTDTSADLLSRIATEPGVCFGRPHLRRQKVLVALVLGFLASGSSPADVLKEFPGIDDDDLLACLAFARARREATAAKTAA